MTSWHLAQMNVARALYPLDDPRLADFVDNLDRINALAEASPGFVWRLQSDAGNATDIIVSDDPQFIINLTVWEDKDSLFDYVYKSAHRDVMVKRREWFEKPAATYQVLWWIKAGTVPTAAEGLARLDALRQDGPTPHAFTFKAMFPPEADTGPTDMKPEPYCVGWS